MMGEERHFKCGKH